MSRPHRLARLIPLIIAFVATRSVSAHFALPTDAPVDRLVTNLESYIKEHPDVANGYYNLARVHSLAFTLKSWSVGVYEHGGIPVPPDDERQKYRRRRAPAEQGNDVTGELTAREMQLHLSEAVQNFDKAIELDPKNSLYFLSFGSLLESATNFKLSSECTVAPLIDTAPQDPALRDAAVSTIRSISAGGDTTEVERIIASGSWGNDSGRCRALVGALVDAQYDDDSEARRAIRRLLDLHWMQATNDCYYRAFQLSFPADSRNKELPISGLTHLISHEAAQGFLRISHGIGDSAPQKARLSEVIKGLATLKRIPPSRAITPIIFSMSPSQSVQELESPGITVAFDLDGTGRPQQWTWVNPETGILVWDPSRTGRVTSGQQLFGSVTWWIFWGNGYTALDGLDDNRDGELSGDELDGLAVWFDRNSNGRSEPGEVVPIDRLGIASISCQATCESGGCPANAHGLTMLDGSQLPTYDWIAQPPRRDSLGVASVLSVGAVTMTVFWIHRAKL